MQPTTKHKLQNTIKININTYNKTTNTHNKINKYT